MREKKLIFKFLLLLLAISACGKSPQLDPENISKPKKIAQDEDHSSFFLTNLKQRERIGLMIGYLKKYDYYILVVVSKEPVDAIYLDSDTKIELSKKSNWFDEPFALINEKLMKKIALSATISTGQTKFKTSKELYFGIKSLISKVNVTLKDQTNYNVDW